MHVIETLKSVMRHRAARAHRRARSRGVTLVEVLIVVAIMALIAGGVGFLILPRFRDAQKDQALQNARRIRGVAITFVALKPGDCPTIESLIAEKQLDGSQNTKDPWGGDYTITCEGVDEIIVSSPGPDQTEGNEDDIVAGGASVEGE